MGKSNLAHKITKMPVWEGYMLDGIESMLAHYAPKDSHVETTPERVVKAYKEMFSGVRKDPRKALSTLFHSRAGGMLHVKEITFYSTCKHHLLPFFGTAFFAYIPVTQIVGLSKIPRLIEMYARRPQVQEDMSEEIVDAFQGIVQPMGCAIMTRAYHFCCMARGIRQPTSYTEYTALRGNFNQQTVKEEFLASVNSSSTVWR